MSKLSKALRGEIKRGGGDLQSINNSDQAAQSTELARAVQMLVCSNQAHILDYNWITGYQICSYNCNMELENGDKDNTQYQDLTQRTERTADHNQ